MIEIEFPPCWNFERCWNFCLQRLQMNASTFRRSDFHAPDAYTLTFTVEGNE